MPVGGSRKRLLCESFLVPSYSHCFFYLSQLLTIAPTLLVWIAKVVIIRKTILEIQVFHIHIHIHILNLCHLKFLKDYWMVWIWLIHFNIHKCINNRSKQSRKYIIRFLFSFFLTVTNHTTWIYPIQRNYYLFNVLLSIEYNFQSIFFA